MERSWTWLTKHNLPLTHFKHVCFDNLGPFLAGMPVFVEPKVMMPQRSVQMNSFLSWLGRTHIQLLLVKFTLQVIHLLVIYVDQNFLNTTVRCCWIMAFFLFHFANKLLLFSSKFSFFTWFAFARDKLIEYFVKVGVLFCERLDFFLTTSTAKRRIVVCRVIWVWNNWN
jgi:hypothetical protein